MPCIDKIAADILNSCDTIPRSGFETIAWAINRKDIESVTHDVTYNTLIEAIAIVGGETAFNVTAVKKEMNAGFDLVNDDDIPDTFLNYFSFKPYEKDAAAITNLDSMNDLVIIAELKGLKTEGCFVIFGLEKGLFKNTGTQRQNDSHGLPIYEMQSQEGQGERYSRFVYWNTNYATSLADIESLVAVLISPAGWDDWTDSDMVDDWTEYPNDTIAESGGLLVITFVDDGKGGVREFTVSDELGQDLIDGVIYRLDVLMKQSVGVGAKYQLNDGSGWLDAVDLTGDWVLYRIPFTYDDADDAGFRFSSMNAGDICQIDTMKLYQLP